MATDEAHGSGAENDVADKIEQEMTPSKKREMLGVNSPKAHGKNVNIFPSDLMTQVTKEDEEKSQAELKARQAEEEESKRREEEEESKRQQHQLEVASAERPSRSGFFQGRCCSWFCCFCSTPPPDVDSNDDQTTDYVHENVEVQTAETEVQTVSTRDAGVEATPDASDEAQVEETSESESMPKEGLLGQPYPEDKGRKCLVLDLDETLVHSSFQAMECSFSLPIQLGGMTYEVYVLKRPHVDEFIKECAKTYELVIFTASLAEYANPVIDELDKAGLIKHRLFRESCVLHQGTAYVKDLSRLGRKLKDCIIIDNSPLSFMFDRYNAIHCTSWFGDKKDTELRDLLPVLNSSLSTVKDVRTMLDAKTQSCQWVIDHYGKPNKSRQE